MTWRGATFMAAGASSPELFASMIGVMSNSAVGVGTVVGSELFNMLVIVGAVCLCAGKKGLSLDWRPLVREVGFFFGSLVLLIFVLHDDKVELWQGLMLVSGYGLYVVVCAYFPQICRAICPHRKGSDEETEFGGTGGLEERFLAGEQREPRDQPLVAVSGDMFGFDYGAVLLHGFLWKSSEYYTKTRMAGSKWQRRWFMLSDDALKYCKNPLYAEDKHCRSINMMEATSVTRTTPTEFELVVESEGTLTFKAQKPELAEGWVVTIEQRINEIAQEKMRLTSRTLMERQSLAADHSGVTEEHPKVIDLPKGMCQRALFFSTFPMLLCFWLTIPDVRRSKWDGRWYIVTMFTAVVWLAILAEGMMQAAEVVGCILLIDPDLMGLTATAVGTSLPNLFASVLVARQGLGNMAVSNAFGSNTFNIFIALGVPWVFGCLKAGSEEGYVYPVPAGHIFGTCMILVGVLTLFLLALGMTGMKLTPTVGWIYIVTYIIFISYLMGADKGIFPEMPF